MSEQNRAQGLLDQALEEETREERGGETISVEEALHQKPVLERDSGRSRTRVLFVTNDTTFLNPTDDSLERFFALDEYFDEIHIVVLRAGTIPTKPVLRVRANIWVYIASAEYWWWTPVIAHEVTTPQQLVFANGFRPDLVVALEPFESAVAARLIARSYNRPWQIHVRESFRTREFKRTSWRNRIRTWIARYTLKRVQSVRVQTSQIKNEVHSWCRHAHIELLPRYYNFDSVAKTEPEFDVHDTYTQYEKILLYVGALDHRSTLHEALDVMKFVLANPRVGLVVLGDGTRRKDVQKKVKKLGLETQVVFPEQVTEIISYLKTADALSVTDTHAVADEVSLQGAVAGIPTLMRETELRATFFRDGENAYVCGVERQCYIDRFKSIVHDATVRQQFQQSLAKTVLPRLAADAQMYRTRYRDTIERVFVDTGDTQNSSESDT